MVEKFFHPKVHTGWDKDMPAKTRRSKMFKAHKKNALSSARALLALSNTTLDTKTKKLSKADSEYFFRLNRKNKDK